MQYMDLFKLPFFILGMRAIFTSSRCGKPVIELGEHRYNKRSNNLGPKARWSCVKARSGKCPATLVTIDNLIVQMSGTHTH